jgi:hypothetical protein
MSIPPSTGHNRGVGNSQPHKHWSLLLYWLRRWILSLLAISIIVWIFVLMVVPRSSTCSVSAVSEIAEITLRDGRGVEARLPSVTLSRRGSGLQALCCSLRLVVKDNANIELARKQRGELLIQLSSASSDLPGELIQADGSAIELHSGDVLHVTLSRPSNPESESREPDTVLLAFRGELRLGEDVGPAVERTLLSGTVRIVERHLLTSDRYVVQEAALDPGDTVVWPETKPGHPEVVSGFIHVGHKDALEVVASAASRYLTVLRFGAPPYTIEASPAERLEHDPWLVGLATLLIMLAALATVVEVVGTLKRDLSPRSHGNAKGHD